MKKLTSIPLTSKRALSIAFALFMIFTEQGPPSILQTDNGGEFLNHAHDHVGLRMLLDDEFIDLVIKEIKNLSASWNMYFKNSTIEFVNSVQLELEETINNMETHDVSPKRGSLRKTAA